MKINSSSFSSSGQIPKRYTSDGQDVSPEFHWSGAPPNAKSFALVMEDPDAPIRPGKDYPFIHWLVYNIPENVNYLPEGIVQIERVQLPVFIDQGKNSFGNIGYGGPKPPLGDGAHHYQFTLYALDTALGVPAGLTKAKLMKFIKPHIIETAECTGSYERKLDRAETMPYHPQNVQPESAPFSST